MFVAQVGDLWIYYFFSETKEMQKISWHTQITTVEKKRQLPCSNWSLLISTLFSNDCLHFLHLADRINGRAHGTVCHSSVNLSVMFCIVAKWYVLRPW